MKNLLANILYYTGVSWCCFFLSRIYYGKHIRVVNYHGTPESQAAQLEKQLKWYSRWYENTSYEELISFIKTGKWTKSKPGIIISFDDGKRNNFDIAKPLLEKFHFIGWFFIPAGWIMAQIEEQKIFQKNDSALIAAYPGERLIMSSLEIKELFQKHVVGTHTMNHHRMEINDSEEILIKEIRDSKYLLENISGFEQNIFCWVGGEEKHYTPDAEKMIRNSGYQVSFTTNTFPILEHANPYNLDRSNIETSYSIPLVLFQLSGIMDVLYYRKRKRLRKVFNPDSV